MARPVWRPNAKSTPRRLGLVLVIALIAFAIIGLRLIDLQAVGERRYTRLGLDQRVHTAALAAERGNIFDRHGSDLAVSVPQQTIYADDRVITDPAAAAAKLAPVLGIDEGTLRVKLADRKKAFVYLARKVDDGVASRVAALHIGGIAAAPESKRFYPSGTIAASLLGFVGTDNNGLSGLETSYDKLLTGRPGELSVERDPQGREIPNGQRSVRPAERGSDLVLTIDQGMQYTTESALVDEVNLSNAKGGMAVIADVQTGDILAMASVDGPANGHPAVPTPASGHNRPLTDVYEPGSTNKVLTVSGALENGVVQPNTVFQVPAAIQIGSGRFEDHDPHGVMPWSVADILRISSNVGAIMIGSQLGPTRLDATMRAFGFGQPTGLGYPGEAGGILLPVSKYSDTSMGTIPTGNGLAVTAMQMLDVYRTIANGGVAEPPRIVAGTIDANGVRHDVAPKPSRRVVSTQTADEVRTMLAGVVKDGTGTKAAIPGYDVAGKTGTARKPPYDHPPYSYMASFAGFAPAQSPRLAAIVVMDQPQSSIYGGEVAAPVFSRIMQYALRLEQIPTSSLSPVPSPSR